MAWSEIIFDCFRLLRLAFSKDPKPPGHSFCLTPDSIPDVRGSEWHNSVIRLKDADFIDLSILPEPKDTKDEQP